MDLNKFIENFSAQFDMTDPSSFTAETIYKNLDEWSSLIALSVIAMVDEEYGASIKGDDIRSTDTIRQLFDIVKARL
ncbi:MAG: acyl carrier protein [Bacteroidota bacterium]